MKKVFTSALLALSLIGSLAYAEKYTVSPKASSFEWIGKKVAGPHNGFVQIKSGALEVSGKNVTGTFTIDLKTITNEDLKDTTWNGKLVGHLKSADFFNVEKFPEAQFKITKTVALKDKNQFEIVGDLTIKGITKSIKFPATIEASKGKVKASANFKIDRTLWDIQYNSGKFFDPKALADKLIDDEIEFKINLAN